MRHHTSIVTSVALLSLLCCLVFPALTSCRSGAPEPPRPIAVKGVLDLRNWSHERDGAANLDGRWEFCPGRLLAPADFAGGGPKDCGYIAVPALWRGQSIGGAPLSGKGEGTYRLIVRFGHGEKKTTLVLHRVYSAYRLYINGELKLQRGLARGAAKKREDYVYFYNRGVASFTPAEGTNEIVIQVLNRDYDSGGIDGAVELADGETWARRESVAVKIDMIIVGLMLAVSIFNMLLYFFNIEDTAPLHIGLAGIIWAVNTYNIRSPLLTGALEWPGNPFLLNYITAILGIVVFLAIMRSLFPRDVPAWHSRIALAVAAALIAPLFFMEFRTGELIIGVASVLALLCAVYGMVVVIMTTLRRREDAVPFAAGLMAIFLVSINNALFGLGIIDTGNMVHYGMAVFCFFSTMVVSRRYARALRSVRVLSRDLADKNAALTKLDLLKDRFLASTSHELRTPLHGMIGLSESMIEGAAGELPPKARENLSLIASSGHRLTGMVNDLLDMAKIQDDGLSLNLRPLDLHGLSETVVKLARPMIGEKPLEIVNAIPPDLPRAWADEDRIRQVLCNLVGNAVKFTNRGRIELSARVVPRGDDDDGASIEVRVSDTGIGVPEEYRRAIFEAYRQVDGSDTRSYGGTGLGLAIAKRIVELHGGAMGVEARDGGGSVFSFTLPVSGERAPAAGEGAVIERMDVAAAGSEDGAPRAGAGTAEAGDVRFEGTPAILAVDDDPVNLSVLKAYLESKGCRVRTTPDGISALEIIAGGGPVDLVLLDIMMPAMSGFEVCRRIRAARSPEELPVIMLTAKNAMADIDAAFEAGANDYIVKPFRMRELLARVGTMLALRSVRRATSRGITIREGNRAYSVAFGEITHITSHGDCIVVHAGNEDIRAQVTMKEILEHLPPDLFVRIHKSHIISIRHLHSVSHVVSGRYRVRLRDADDTELPVGPSYLESLRKKI
jgi:two-component system, sensor histidine kinase ChiS